MSTENAEYEALMEEFNAVTSQLEEVLKDLEWRKPDVEGEEDKLRDLQEQAKTDPMTDVATQAVIVRVLRGILDDKIAEANRLEKRMLEIKERLEQIITGEEKPAEEAAHVEAVREKEE